MVRVDQGHRAGMVSQKIGVNSGISRPFSEQRLLWNIQKGRSEMQLWAYGFEQGQ